jgi:hypothetical protein
MPRIEELTSSSWGIDADADVVVAVASRIDLPVRRP